MLSFDLITLQLPDSLLDTWVFNLLTFLTLNAHIHTGAPAFMDSASIDPTNWIKTTEYYICSECVHHFWLIILLKLFRVTAIYIASMLFPNL